MQRARLILNPIPWAQRAWNKLPEVVNLLEEAGIRVDLSFTKITEALTLSVRQAVEEGYSLVIVGGGDGTVSEVAGGLVGTGMPLGILPFGTFNNVAHSLGLPLDLAEAASNIAQANTVDIDVGVVGRRSFTPSQFEGVRDTFFFEAAGVGLDASVFPIGEEIKGGHYEKVLEGAMKFLGHRKANFTLVLDGKQVKVRSPMVVVANGPYYGAGFTVAPQADLSDGTLDVICFDCSKTEMVRQFALSARNRSHTELCLLPYRAREITIVPELPLPAHADGKPIGNAPITCRVLPRALRVIVPPGRRPGQQALAGGQAQDGQK
ncbi:MAG: diacylglycerol kinase family lipid kinase [Chloroflexi bacterium]|nr:diacylglycerol kinase family lipid kinase [Chloroflexota bacterium]